MLKRRCRAFWWCAGFVCIYFIGWVTVVLSLGLLPIVGFFTNIHLLTLYEVWTLLCYSCLSLWYFSQWVLLLLLVLSVAGERGGAGLSFELLYVRIAILLAEIQTFVLSLVIFLSTKLIMCLVRTYGSVSLLLCIRTMSVIGLCIYCVTGFFSVWPTQCLLIIAYSLQLTASLLYRYKYLFVK